MKIQIVAVGRMKAGPERELSARYFDRFAKSARAVGLSFDRPLELAESRRPEAGQRKQEEARAILDRIPPDAVLLALDERGESIGSAEFAGWLARHRDAGAGSAHLVLGGADGLDEAVRRRADTVLSFGRMTWPHQLARIMLAEQLYRAAAILSGHPYHRA